MALLTDDRDLNDATIRTMYGGNGDYYIVLNQSYDEFGLNYQNIGVRFAMSGGCISRYPKVAEAVAKLHEAMEEYGLNDPDNKQ